MLSTTVSNRLIHSFMVHQMHVVNLSIAELHPAYFAWRQNIILLMLTSMRCQTAAAIFEREKNRSIKRSPEIHRLSSFTSQRMQLHIGHIWTLWCRCEGQCEIWAHFWSKIICRKTYMVLSVEDVFDDVPTACLVDDTIFHILRKRNSSLLINENVSHRIAKRYFQISPVWIDACRFNVTECINTKWQWGHGYFL